MEHSEFFIKLRGLLEKLPGIGPRQANRFIWAFLDFRPEEQRALGEAVIALGKHLCRCSVCFRVFPVHDGETTCSFCAPKSSRNQEIIMVVERDSDLLNIERSGLFKGVYHVLGGMFDPLESENIVRERIKALYERLARGQTSDVHGTSDVEEREIILALSPTKMGEFTSEYIKKVLEPLLSRPTAQLQITRLGRGLSTGIELEYADELTLRQAIDNRK